MECFALSKLFHLNGSIQCNFPGREHYLHEIAELPILHKPMAGQSPQMEIGSAHPVVQ